MRQATLAGASLSFVRTFLARSARAAHSVVLCTDVLYCRWRHVQQQQQQTA